jgi:hypothetical protein
MREWEPCSICKLEVSIGDAQASSHCKRRAGNIYARVLPHPGGNPLGKQTRRATNLENRRNRSGRCVIEKVGNKS